MQGYHRGLFDQFGDSADAVCCGFTFVTLLGPFLLLSAALIATGVLGVSHGNSAMTMYNNAVAAWTDNDFMVFSTLFNENTTVTVNITMGGTDKIVAPPLTVELLPETHIIGGALSGAATYSDALFFQGEFDLWGDGWPASDQYISFSVPNIPAPVTILAFLCTNTVQKVPCSSVPPAPGRRHLHKSAPAPGGCLGFFRQVTVLSSVTLLAQPPKYANSNWTLNVNHCDEYPWVALEQVSETVYNDDVSKLPWPGANPAWCLNWQNLFSTRPNASTMTLRASTDPFIVEGVATNCTYSTSQVGVRAADSAEAHTLLMPGFGIVAFTGIVLAILVSRYNKAEDRAATTKKFGLGNEETPLATRKPEEEAPYGATEGGKGASFKRVLSQAD